jgi:methionine biosynthesis protein MetW
MSDQVQRFEDRRWAAREQPTVERHRSAVGLVRRAPVLDVGGGDGLFLSLLQQRGIADVHLLDVSPVAVDRARAKGITAAVGDITGTLPYSDGQFGTACALDVLEHLYDPLATLRELARVASEVVVSVPNFGYWKERWQMLAGQVPFQSRPARGHVYWFTPATAAAMAADAGLRVDEVDFGGLRRLGPVGPKLARLRPSLFATTFTARLVP